MRGASREGKLMERHVGYKSGSRGPLSRTVHENPQRVSIREWLCVEKESGRPRPPLEKWLVKLIRAKWGLNGVGIDRAAGFCTTGTSRMFGHPSQLPG